MGRIYVNKTTGERVEFVPICPKCRAAIYWSLMSGVTGARTSAHCANNISATRIIKDLETMITCNWEGFAIRRADNEVDIYDKKMRLVPQRIIRK